MCSGVVMIKMISTVVNLRYNSTRMNCTQIVNWLITRWMVGTIIHTFCSWEPLSGAILTFIEPSVLFNKNELHWDYISWINVTSIASLKLQVLIYDLRSSHPVQVKDHMWVYVLQLPWFSMMLHDEGLFFVLIKFTACLCFIGMAARY